MKLLAILLIGAVAIAAKPTTETPPVDCPDESESVKKVFYDYFGAVEKKDFDSMSKLITPDFTLFEGGHVWNHDSLVTAFNKTPDLTIKYTMTDLKVQTDCNSAFIRYVNSGDLTMGEKNVKVTWIESATFRKEQDTWKLAFVHSSVKK